MKISYGAHDLRDLKSKNIFKSLNQDLVTNGTYCEKLEKKICTITKSKFSVVCNNGTSALYLSIRALFGRKKIIAIIPNINFVASMSILHQLNAKMIICDVNSKGMIDKNTLTECLKKAQKKNIKPNLIIPIHYSGLVFDSEEIFKICKRKNITIIEDGCHSFGSKLIKKKSKMFVGQSKYSSCTTFSFHPVKNITTIEGGAITTNNKVLYKNLKLLRSHGLKTTKIFDPYKLIMPSLNFRLGEINAAIGLQQIVQMEKFKKKRQNIVNFYLKKLVKFSKFFLPLNHKSKDIFWHLFVIKFLNEKSHLKKKFMIFLKKKNITTQIHYKPMHMHKCFQDKILVKSIQNSERFYKQQLTIPLHTNLTLKDLNKIIFEIDNFFKKYS